MHKDHFSTCVSWPLILRACFLMCPDIEIKWYSFEKSDHYKERLVINLKGIVFNLWLQGINVLFVPKIYLHNPKSSISSQNLAILVLLVSEGPDAQWSCFYMEAVTIYIGNSLPLIYSILWHTLITQNKIISSQTLEIFRKNYDTIQTLFHTDQKFN